MTHSYAEDEICKSYVGQKISGNTFDFYYQKAKSLNFRPKNEFESTDAYNKFLDSNAARINLPKYVVIEIPVYRKFITFDADNWLIKIGKFSINNDNTLYGNVFQSKYNKSFSDDIRDITISSEVRPTGKYLAKTVFGGNVLVHRQQSIYKSIFDQPKDESVQELISQTDKPLQVISVSHDDAGLSYAKAFKTTSKAYAVVSLKPPYAVVSSDDESEPTLNDRVANTVINKVLFADIKCLIVADQTQKAVYSEDMNPPKKPLPPLPDSIEKIDLKY